MGFSKQRFAIFWSLPPDDQDWVNLALSRVKLVMIMLEFCDAVTLTRLRDMGCRVVIRVNEGAYYDDAAPTRIRNLVLGAKALCPVEAVIIGNEADHAQDLQYGSANWGQAWAYQHRKRFDALRKALQLVGVKVISPALIMRSISEDEYPAPGQVAWREILCLPDNGYGYLDAEGNGVHLYMYHADGPVDTLRALFALKYYATIWHKPLWIDEIGIPDKRSQVEKMRAYIAFAEYLLSIRDDGKQHPLGQRVEFLCPFVGNGIPGDPPAWNPNYLIRDPNAYRLLGDWLK